MSDGVYDRGLAKLQEVDKNGVARVVDGLKDIAPDLARYVVEFGFGEIYSRPGLDLKSRQIAMVAGLAVLGTAEPQLKVHIHGALNVGCTRQEIIEVLLQMIIVGGFPVALNGVAAARAVFAERDAAGSP
jgi:4-carboxymuconolactone decarboxylase